jgi:hypothetical protein
VKSASAALDLDAEHALQALRTRNRIKKRFLRIGSGAAKAADRSCDMSATLILPTDTV